MATPGYHRGCDCTECRHRRKHPQLYRSSKPVVVQPEPEWSPYRDAYGFGVVRAFWDLVGV